MALDSTAVLDMPSSHRRETSHAPTDRRPEPDRWFTALYEQNAAWLLGFALRLTSQDRQRAQDVTQETLIRVWRFAPDPLPADTTSLRPWLATIARHVSINQYRKALTRPQEHRYDDHTMFPSVPDDTARVLRLMPITEALRSLNDIHREILVEIYFHGRTVTETSRLLNIATGTAKSRLHNALRAMRQALLLRGDAGLITG